MIKFFRKIRFNLMETGNTSKYIKYAIGEIVLVMIGILLALQVSNWNETRKTKKNISITLNLIKDEIHTNKQSINRVKKYHIMVKDTLLKIEEPKADNEIKDIFSFWKGMQTPRLQSAAFQISIQSGLSKKFNPKLLQTLNTLYTYQDSYNDFSKSAGQIFFSADFSDIKNFNRIVTSIQMSMTDLYYYERELTELLDVSLQKIENDQLK